MVISPDIKRGMRISPDWIAVDRRSWPSGSRIVILTNLNAGMASLPNLYTVNLRYRLLHFSSAGL